MSKTPHIDDYPHLTPRDETLAFPEKLKRSEMDGFDATLWEELCIAASENELDSRELQKTEEFKQALGNYNRLKLKADQQITYPNKSSLKKGVTRITLWISAAAAAAVLLVAIPAIIQNISSDRKPPKIATIPYASDEVQQKSPENSSINQVENNSVKPQPEHIVPQAEPSIVEVAADRKNGIKEKEAEAEMLDQRVKRESLRLEIVETPKNTILAISTKESIKQHTVKTVDRDVILLASSEEINQIEVGVERPNILDRLKEKSIVNLNKLRGEGTMVVKEYNSDGKLTLYAVQSNTLRFEKKYEE